MLSNHLDLEEILESKATKGSLPPRKIYIDLKFCPCKATREFCLFMFTYIVTISLKVSIKATNCGL